MSNEKRCETCGADPDFHFRCHCATVREASMIGLGAFALPSPDQSSEQAASETSARPYHSGPSIALEWYDGPLLEIALATFPPDRPDGDQYKLVQVVSVVETVDGERPWQRATVLLARENLQAMLDLLDGKPVADCCAACAPSASRLQAVVTGSQAPMTSMEPDAVKRAIAGALAMRWRALTDEQRLELSASCCRGCGSLDPRCQCWNDE